MEQGQSSPCMLPAWTPHSSSGVSLCAVSGSHPHPTPPPREPQEMSNDSDGRQSSQKGTGAGVQRPRSLLPQHRCEPELQIRCDRGSFLTVPPPQLDMEAIVPPV